MYTKEYYLSLISTTISTQIYIPLSLLTDNSILELIIKYKWKINISDYNWATLVKS